jgi:hypothetical protein
MPWFRFIDELKVTLQFRNGPCELTFANLDGPDGWAWVAQKPKGEPLVLVRASNVLGLQAVLKNHGFEVKAGSPQEKIMRAAERCGYVEELPEEKRWREELIQARARASRRP